MPQANNGEIVLEYETVGDPSANPLLLIMGFTAQMTAWPDPFFHQLADAGHYVIRFDNRDCGLSSKSTGEAPSIMSMMATLMAGGSLDEVPYTLSHMADDAIAVLDHLEIERAHVAGASMGGMIAQTTAIDHPGRVSSLISIMSTTGNPEVGQASPEAMTALITPPPTDREGAIERSVELGRLISGPLFDEEAARLAATLAYDRSFHPGGAAFQMAAIMASGDRTDKLGSVEHPALVIHGSADPLITPSGGEATAAALANAELLMLEQMGHNIPEPLWTEIIDAITKVTANS